MSVTQYEMLDSWKQRPFLQSLNAVDWSWDPKESWALIVWLNYAAHQGLARGAHGVVVRDWIVCHAVRLSWREYVFVRPAFLW